MNLKRTFQSFRRNRREKKLLAELNARLPRGINWKEGAIAYLSSIINDSGSHNKRYELVKPFIGGPDFSPFFTEFYSFLNLLEKLKLPARSRILDIACGAGWTAHYMAKLGHSVIGLDISKELLDLAFQRIAGDPFPPFEDQDFQIGFIEHDIEESAPPAEEPFDALLLFSAMHHFYNPIAAIRNCSKVLKPDGLIAISESTAPEPGSSFDTDNHEIMKKHHTLERPYSRDQLREILDMCGFTFQHYYQPVNGLFLPLQSEIDTVTRDITLRNWNIVIASRAPDRMPDNELDQTEHLGKGTVKILTGIYNREIEPDAGSYRWVTPNGRISVSNLDQIKMTLEAVFMDPELQRMKIFIKRNGTIVDHIILNRDSPEVTIEYTDLQQETIFQFMSDYVFRPEWYDLPDARMLSFKLRIEAPLEE